MPTIKLLRDSRNKYKRRYDNKSGRRAERHEIYDTVDWRNLRNAKFLDHPTCEMCEKEGRVKPADDIHHIVSFMSVSDPMARRALAFDYGNLMSICRDCHNKIHAGSNCRADEEGVWG